MNAIMKSIGGLILLLGVGVLMIPAFMDVRDNKLLLLGLGTIILGFLVHIILNKRY